MPVSKITIDAIRDALSKDTSGSESVLRVLERLPQLLDAQDDPIAVQRAWNSVYPDLRGLSSAEGGPLDRNILDKLVNEVSSVTVTLEEFQEVARQVLDKINAQNSDIASILLPQARGKLKEEANVAFLLRALALQPKRVLPPGKSLLSLFSKGKDDADEEKRKRAQEVEAVIKRAYWDAAYEQLASPSPDVQIPRIKVFYHDLWEALKPLVPQTHPLMVILTSPLSPSSNPLASALHYLQAALTLMRSLCAPARDEAIDESLASLAKVDKLHAPRDELAKAYTSGIRFALDMCGTMVDDLQSFMAKYGNESNVAAMLRASAREHERQAIIGAFGKEEIQRAWKEWAQKSWRDQMVDVVGDLNPLMQAADLLPSTLIMSRVDLAEAQTLLLGLVISASIRTLVPALSQTRLVTLYNNNSKAIELENQFMGRVWTLIGADPFATDHATQESDIDNIAAEVFRIWKLRNPNEQNISAKEKEFGDMVRRMINEETHPVRVLLKKRVTDALKERLAQPIVPIKQEAPTTVAAGRALQPTARLKSSKIFPSDQKEADLVISGFGDPVLKNHLHQILHILRVVESWVEYVWKDIE